MEASNPYAPPQAAVHDVLQTDAPLEHADLGTRFAAANPGRYCPTCRPPDTSRSQPGEPAVTHNPRCPITHAFTDRWSVTPHFVPVPVPGSARPA